MSFEVLERATPLKNTATDETGVAVSMKLWKHSKGVVQRYRLIFSFTAEALPEGWRTGKLLEASFGRGEDNGKLRLASMGRCHFKLACVPLNKERFGLRLPVPAGVAQAASLSEACEVISRDDISMVLRLPPWARQTVAIAMPKAETRLWTPPAPTPAPTRPPPPTAAPQRATHMPTPTLVASQRERFPRAVQRRCTCGQTFATVWADTVKCPKCLGVKEDVNA